MRAVVEVRTFTHSHSHAYVTTIPFPQTGSQPDFLLNSMTVDKVALPMASHAMELKLANSMWEACIQLTYT